jgi:lipoprotein-anchoring transpeptidase ErfK/SrfK
MEVDGHRTVLAERQPRAGKSYFLGNTAFSNAFLRIAVLTAAGIAGAAVPAEAATYFWSDNYEIMRPQPRIVAQPPRRKSAKPRIPKAEYLAREARKPQGPLILAISIDRQVLKVYDANGYFAETPISTGMRGHSTPMGVFSIIEKQKFHRSNIYSGAPMPYMQRITWSGVAMHAGVLPGYPASHGCIRMPMSFATRMYGWTRMGARVVVTPGDLTPESFSHPLLATQKIVSSPAAAAEPPTTVAVTAKSDKQKIADAAARPSFSESSLELKSTVGHDLAKPGEANVSRTHTADASSALSQSTMSDAIPSARATKADDEAAVAAAETATPAKDAVATDSDAKAGETKSEATVAEVKPAGNDASDKADAKNETPAGENVKAESTTPEAAKVETADVKPDAARSEAPKAVDKPEEPVKAAADANVAIPDVQKDQARPSDPEKTAAPKPAVAAAPKRSGQIAVFVSKKDSKLYVRQNFSPLFDVPVMIAASDRPLGTHVFTAQVDKEDANLLHWSVVSMPFAVRQARLDDDDRASRRRRTTGAIEVKPAPVPDSAAEALDRLTIPADAMARITEALSTGGSIIVSDQGINAGETGEGTDFIIPLR